MKVSPIALMFLFASSTAAFSEFGLSTTRSSKSQVAEQRTIKQVEGGVVVRQRVLSDQELRSEAGPILNGGPTRAYAASHGRPTWLVSSSTKQVEPTSEGNSATPVAGQEEPKAEKKSVELNAHVVTSRVAMLRERYRRAQEQKANDFQEEPQKVEEFEMQVPPPVQTEAVIPKDTVTFAKEEEEEEYDDPELAKMHERVNMIRERYLLAQQGQGQQKAAPKPTMVSGSNHFVGSSPTALQAVRLQRH